MQNEIYSNKLKTVCNAVIQIGDIDDTGKGRHFVSKFIQDGLVKIEGHGIVLLKKETIDQSLQSMVGAPVIIKHQDVTNENADELRCGVISKAYFNDFDGWYYCEGIIWDEKAKELVNKGWSVSCSYDFLAYNDEGGVENNIKYDKEFTQLNFTHLAIVNNPRYERANIVFNCKTNKKEQDKMILNALKDFITHIENERDSELGSDKGKWVTINGNHIFIRDGQTLGDAMDERGWGKKESKEKTKSNTFHVEKFDDKGKEEVSKASKGREQDFLKKSEEYKKQGDFISANAYTDLANIEKDRQKAFGKGSSSETKKETNTTKDTRRHIDRIEKLIKKYNLEPHEEDELLDELGSFEAKLDENLEPREEEELREELFDFEDDIKRHQEMKKQESKQSDKTKEKGQLKSNSSDTAKKFGFKKASYGDNDFEAYDNSSNVLTQVSYEKDKGSDKYKFWAGSTGGDYFSDESIDYYADSIEDGFAIAKEKFERAKKDQAKFNKLVDFMYKAGDNWVADSTKRKDFEKILGASSLSKGDYEDMFELDGDQREYYHEHEADWSQDVLDDWLANVYSNNAIRYFNKKIKYSKKANNSKEIDMKILNELKKLISKVENEKGEQDMDEKEKVDNENVDKRKLIDEVAGIMKSAGCDDEDIRTAIGKMEKIGYDKSEAGSADNKKVKNEEPDKKDDKKVENEDEKDKEKAEELKKDVKEDVDNKCKNSKSSFDKINEIYNSVKQIEKETGYVSRQQKLDNAVEYFK